MASQRCDTPFHSVLGECPGGRGTAGPTDAGAPGGADGESAYLADLNLDQVVDAVTAGRDGYDLKPFFRTPLRSADAIAYRHEVFRDLEATAALTAVREFADGMAGARERLARAAEHRDPHERERWRLDAACAYGEAVRGLARGLAGADLRSRGLAGFRDYLARHISSPAFASLADETAALRRDLDGVGYCLHIKGNRIRVRAYDGEDDYSEDVAATFAKFRQGDVKDYRARLPDRPYLNHVETGVLRLVAKIFPDVFAALADFSRRRQDFLDPAIVAFDREIQFYVAYLEHIGRLRGAGLAFCYPHVDGSKDVHARQTFDVALAGKLVSARAPVVCNDVHLSGPERMLVVSGPNQGGKTTLARAFGQLHHLARLGCPVPGSDARLPLCDQVLTHFEREEDPAAGHGGLRDDLVRVRDILRRATPDSVVILNEIFSSTTPSDALELAASVMADLLARGVAGVLVTFLDELASLSEATVSMVAEVDPGDPTRRTYRVARRPADGMAHAMALAARHGLTYEQLRGRLAP